MDKLYVLLVGVSHWNNEPTAGCGAEVVLTDSIESYSWDMQQQEAENHAEWDETEENWEDFVEANSYSMYVEYNPENPEHYMCSGSEAHRDMTKANEVRLNSKKANIANNIARAEARIHEKTREVQELLDTVFILRKELEDVTSR